MSRATAVKLPVPMKIQRSVLLATAKMPNAVRARLSRLAPVNADGDRLDPMLTAITLASKYIPSFALMGKTVEESRRSLDLNSAMMAESFGPFAVEEDLVMDTAAGPVPATRYSLDGNGRGLIVFYHGGGFVVGSRVSHDSAVRALAVASGADVLAVDYRLAPEHRFPAAVDDSVAAFRYAVAKAADWGIDPNQIVVAGDSAGGNLAAVVAQQVRGDDVVPCLQLLVYPVVDMSRKRPSIHEFSTGFFLTEADMDYFRETYQSSADDVSDPRFSPLLAESLSGLPDAHVAVAGFDPLRDEGLEYADALEKAGVSVTVDRVGPMIHGFLNMGLLTPVARDSIARMGEAIKRAVAAA
ncbi:alpha/beta hydrolase [Gordonia sp. (in: high G+C Gram-positive bacteria)]|uniref:alpha/beta hydrolase n=1 Tax=Gordonia sp. (in: high G+C Gram-positive bacteria) TaxID=84139 RepID=UPI003C71CD77